MTDIENKSSFIVWVKEKRKFIILGVVAVVILVSVITFLFFHYRHPSPSSSTADTPVQSEEAVPLKPLTEEEKKMITDAAGHSPMYDDYLKGEVALINAEEDKDAHSLKLNFDYDSFCTLFEENGSYHLGDYSISLLPSTGEVERDDANMIIYVPVKGE